MRSPAEGTAMLVVEAEIAPLYEALDIAVGYLVRSGYGLRQASDAAYMHIVPLFTSCIDACESSHLSDREREGGRREASSGVPCRAIQGAWLASL